MAAIETAREVCRNAAQACPGIATYCVTRVRFGVVEAVNANIRMLIHRGRSYQNLRYLLLKAKRVAMTNVEFLAVRWVAKAA